MVEVTSRLQLLHNARMAAVHKIAPLQPDALALRWRQALHDEEFDRLSDDYRLELDQYGELIVSPRPTNYHQALAGIVCDQLRAALGGFALSGEVRILTPIGVRSPDGVWTTEPARIFEEPIIRAPEICIEIASPSNSPDWLARKAAAFLDAGAREVVVVSADGSSAQYFRADGVHEQSMFATLRLPLTTFWN